MTWSNETVERYLNKAIDKINKYMEMPVEDVPVCVSKGNSKVPCLNISKMSGATCGNCAACLKGGCYDANDANRYPNVLDARARNTAVLYKDPARYFKAFEDAMTNRRKYHAGRYDVGGELTGEFELDAMNSTAMRKSNWALWTYTKMHDMVNRWIATGKYTASNLQIMYSRRGVNDKIENPYGMPEFVTVLPNEVPPTGYMKCPGACRECLEKKIGCPYGYNVWAHLHR